MPTGYDAASLWAVQPLIPGRLVCLNNPADAFSSAASLCIKAESICPSVCTEDITVLQDPMKQVSLYCAATKTKTPKQNEAIDERNRLKCLT